MVSCPVGPVSPICWSSRKRWCAWWTKATQLILTKPLTPPITDFFWRKWSPSVLVMSLCVGLKHTFLGGNHSNAQWYFPRLRDRPTVVSPFRERLPRCTQSTDAALCRWRQNGNSTDTGHEPSQLSYCRIELVAEMAPTNQPCWVQIPHHWAKSPTRLYFSPIGLAPHPCIQVSRESRGSDRQCIFSFRLAYWSCK